jgi:hypothetical protein
MNANDELKKLFSTSNTHPLDESWFTVETLLRLYQRGLAQISGSPTTGSRINDQRFRVRHKFLTGVGAQQAAPLQVRAANYDLM